MKKVTIGICICLFFILLLLIASLVMTRFIWLRLRKNLVPYIYLPLLLATALVVRAYDDINAIIKFEYGKTSFVSECGIYIVSALPNSFVALALALNLAMWLDFVFSSYYSIQRRFLSLSFPWLYSPTSSARILCKNR